MSKRRDNLPKILLELEMPVARNINNAPCQTTDPETFFPDPTDYVKIKLAKSFCAKCELTTKENCLSFAMTNKVHYGVWGGLTEAERKSLERQRYRAKLKESK